MGYYLRKGEHISSWIVMMYVSEKRVHVKWTHIGNFKYSVISNLPSELIQG